MTDISSINPLNEGFSKHYTPTTEEVRHQYSYNIVDKWYEAERAPEFDRWLAGVITQERERIRANIIDRVQDLSSCAKHDNCKELGALIASYIDEWLDEGANSE